MKRYALPLFLLMSLASFAQTYTSNSPYNCNPTTHYTITSFSQFECHLVVDYSAQGSPAEYQFFGPSRFEMFAPFAIPPNYATLLLTQFTQPSGGNPGTYTFNWSGTDQQGIYHEGTASGTWVSGPASWRGWRGAELVTHSIMINQ